MADYNSTYTGAEVDASVAKSQGIPSATDVTSAVNKSLALAPATDINEAIQPAAASAGDVWTADGDGGAAWVAPSGGGSQLYQHYIRMNGSTEYYDFSFISSDSQFTTFDGFRNMLTAKGYTSSSTGLPVNGVILNNGYVGVGTVTSNLHCFFRDTFGTRASTYAFSGTSAATAGISITAFTDSCTSL